MAGKIRLLIRFTVEQKKPALLPLPLACLIVSLIWFWVRVHLGMPANTPLFHGGPFIFGDGLAMALGIGGILFAVLWIVGMVMSIVLWIKDLFP